MSLVKLTHPPYSDRNRHKTTSALSVSIGQVKPLIKMLATQGVPPQKLLESTDIPLSQLCQYDVTIQYDQYLHIIQNALLYSPQQTLGIKLGEQFYINNDGILACRIMSCNNAAEAMVYLSKYQSLLTHLFELTFDLYEEHAVFSADPVCQMDDYLLPFFIEYLFSSIYSLGRFCTGSKIYELEFEFSYAKPTNINNYSSYFGRKLSFSRTQNKVLIPNSILYKPFIFESRISALTHDQICKTIVSHNKEETAILKQVRAIIRDQQFENVTLETVSRALCMAPRTLRRHLQNHQVSYKDLLEQERINYAQKSLKENKPFKVIAENLGYQDASSFSRAFKKWFGVTPKNYLHR